MPFDFPTIAFLGLLLYFSIALGFSMILLVQPGQRVPRLWAGSLWAGALSTALFSLPLPIPEVASILLRNLLAMTCSLLLLAGVALHVGRRPPWKPALALAGLYLLGIAWFSIATPDLRVRLVLYSAIFIVWKAWEAGLLLRYAPAELRISTRLAATVFLLDAGVFLLRAAAPVAPDAGGDALRAGLPMYITYVGGLFTTLAQCFALMLMIVERQLAQLRRLARTDPLTGALNRAALLEDGRLQLELCQRQQRPCSALMLDLDHFKQVNDRLGHQAGDAALRHTVQVLRSNLRRYDVLLGRYGGEEFALLLPGVALADAAELAERLRAALAGSPATGATQRIPLSASFGVADAGPDRDLDELLDHADRALYRAKHAGRNRVACADAAAGDDQAVKDA